jgi:hypothetical protein
VLPGISIHRDVVVCLVSNVGFTVSLSPVFVGLCVGVFLFLLEAFGNFKTTLSAFRLALAISYLINKS